MPDEGLDPLREAAQRVDGALRAGLEASGRDESRVLGEYASGSIIEDADDTFALRFLYAFWRLYDQRIGELTSVERFPSDVHLPESAGVPPDVRLVRLRRADSSAPGALPSRPWQHRWVVRMHKVRQWYPSEGRHKIIYRGPYVKGPADKPIVSTTNVWGLVR